MPPNRPPNESDILELAQALATAQVETQPVNAGERALVIANQVSPSLRA